MTTSPTPDVMNDVHLGEVPEAFDEVADRYDLMVAMNPGYHAHLRASADALADALAHLDPNRAGPYRVVDLGCGSGASTRALVAALDDRSLRYELVGVDGSAGMLREAQAKTWPGHVRFVHARAEELATREDVTRSGPIDGIFAAYLVRNVTARDELLATLHDLLTPGGALVIHEYSVAGNRRAEAVWTAVCRGVVVPLGYVTSRRTRLYRYLWQSVMQMDSTEVLMQRLLTAGFEDVGTRSVRGWQQGIIHTFRAWRPE